MRGVASRITCAGCTSSRQCCAAASPPKKPGRSPEATTCASFVLRLADVLRPSTVPEISTGEKATTAIDQTQAQPNEAAVSAALAVLDRFMAALNAGNEPACSQHYTSRITGFPPARYGLGISPVPTLATFFALAGPDWHHSGWGFCKVIAAGATEVHLDVQFTRYRADK